EQDPLGNFKECRRAARRYRLRAAELQQARKNREALDHLKVLLRLSLHLRNKAITAVFLLGLEVQGEALSGREDWAAACDDTVLMREALQALRTHESELPPLDDVLKADYLGAYAKLRGHYVELTTPKGLGEAPATLRMHGHLFLLSQET